ncbi:MAG TPA: PP2C family serine/threonine-protein phosphatase [Mycobacteriales bacterium]|nr:PP2C family serine/threonine-protein phosphatase [Mycobacteriales bacterium]
MSIALRYAVRSDRGLIRDNNEDSVYAGARLLAIADGMGGHAGGEVASKLVISTLAYLDEDTPRADLLDALREATESANERVRQAVEADPELDGMGTTLTALLFAGRRLGLLHIGDSRCYLLRSTELSQITRDDTFVQALVDEGRLTQEEASTHPQRSLLLHALNGGELEPDLSVREVRVGDRYLLCSDGLSDVVSAETIHEALSVEGTQAAAHRLVELALRSGGPDNITVIVADVIDTEYGDDVPVMDGAAGLNNGRREVAPNSAAARAAIAAPVTKEKAEEKPERMASPPPRPRRLARRLILGTLAAVVLGGGMYALWQWTQTQYFVGAAEDRVAVYQGINASIGPLHFYRLDYSSDLSMSDLEQVARDTVWGRGLTAGSQQQAEEIIGRLRREQLLPPCPLPAASPSPSLASPAPKPPLKPAARPGASHPAGRTSAAPASTVPPSLLPTATPEPGRDCRVVG